VRGGGVAAEAVGLDREPGRAGAGDAVVAAQPGVDDLFAIDLDEPFVGHPVQRGVQRARAEDDPALGEPLDLLEQGVPVLGRGGQRGEDQERRFLQRLVTHVFCIFS